MPYTQFCAGTDTLYSSTLNDSPIPNGYDDHETLSRIFDGIEGDALPAPAVSDMTSRLAVTKPQKAQYVNGPSTLATNIGQCMANNLLGVLQAISEGETTINLVAHSRGAVAAILITHELDKLRETLQTNPSANIYDILIKTPCKYTPAALQSEEAKIKALSDKVKKHLASVQVHLFGVDPVPGGSFFGTGGYTKWYDERFYKLPSIVKTAEIILYKNEWTRCFKPIVPEPHPGTQFTLLSLSGHHGTGSGNLRDQQRTFSDDIIAHTQPVQQLMLRKITRFLAERGVTFSAAHADAFKTDHPTMHALYTEVYGKHKEIQRFNQTAYAYLGKEQSFWGSLPDWIKKDLFGVENTRLIHYRGNHDTYLTQALPQTPGFENIEHLKLELELHHQMTLEATNNPAILLNNFTAKLASLSETLNHTSLPVISGIFNALVQLISQSYLRNHLSSEEKQLLLQSIQTFFEFLESHPLFNDIIAPAKQKMIQTLKKRAQALENLHTTLIEACQAEHIPTQQPASSFDDLEQQRQFIETQCTDFLIGVNDLDLLLIEPINNQKINLISTQLTLETLAALRLQKESPINNYEACLIYGYPEHLGAILNRIDLSALIHWLEAQPQAFLSLNAIQTIWETYKQNHTDERLIQLATQLLRLTTAPSQAFESSLFQHAIERKNAAYLIQAYPTKLQYFLAQALSTTPQPSIIIESLLIKQVEEHIHTLPQYLADIRQAQFTLSEITLNQLYECVETKHLPLPEALPIYAVIWPLYFKMAAETNNQANIQKSLHALQQYPDLLEQVEQSPLVIPSYDTLAQAFLPNNPNIGEVKETLALLHEACNQYLHYYKQPQNEQDTQKHQLIQTLQNISNPQNKTPLQNFLAAKKTLQDNYPILSKNNDSRCQFFLKILAVLSIIGAVVLAAKRFKETNGKSFNFFQPLSKQLILQDSITSGLGISSVT